MQSLVQPPRLLMCYFLSVSQLSTYNKQSWNISILTLQFIPHSLHVPWRLVRDSFWYSHLGTCTSKLAFCLEPGPSVAWAGEVLEVQMDYSALLLSHFTVWTSHSLTAAAVGPGYGKYGRVNRISGKQERFPPCAPHKMTELRFVNT